MKNAKSFLRNMNLSAREMGITLLDALKLASEKNITEKLKDLNEGECSIQKQETTWLDNVPEQFGPDNFKNTVVADNNEYNKPLVTPEEQEFIISLYNNNPDLQGPYHKAWIQTFTGKKLFPLMPTEDSIDILDIAHALSNICRFTGHVSEFYSVAQHSVLVSYICDKENALAGLLHDASESALQDISSPVKSTPEFIQYKNIEANLQSLIYKKFGCPEIESADVKRADLLLLATEARDLMSPLHKDWKMDINPLPFTIVPLPPKEAEQLFLNRFKELYSSK